MTASISPSAFLAPNDPRLKAVAAEVPQREFDTHKLHDLIGELLTIARGGQGGAGKQLVGLAAPQVGIPKRIIVVDTGAVGNGPTGKLEAFINPRIIYASRAASEWYEGCFSTGNVYGIVSRHDWIEIAAFVETSRGVQEINREFSRYAARIVQHEIDHLNGILFPSRITDPKKLHWVEPDEFSAYRDQSLWRDWKHLCSHERWERIQNTPA
jgi:peptide deformylase